MNLSRRRFIRQAACAALGTTSIASTVWNLRALNAAVAQSSTTSDYRALVCLFLYGGNDANNLLVPVDNTNYNSYAAARGILAIPQASLLPISPATASADGRQYGLHPSCPELQTLFGNGKLALLANVGTLVAPITRAQYFSGGAAVPPQLFSHADQQVEWQTSWPDSPQRTGWGGRMADLLVSMNGSASISMSISLAGTNTFQVGNQVFGYQVSTSGPVGLSGTTGTNNALRYQAIQNILNLPAQNLYEAEFAKITNRAIANYGTLNSLLVNQTALTTTFPTSNPLADQLKMIARLIGLRDSIGVKRQIFFCSIGGFDTHSDQLTGQSNLFAELSQALNAFYNATVELGVDSQVTTFTASDFGRTFPTNGTASSSGSDHGWGSHHLVMGGAVKGGDIYGTVPTLVVNGPDDTGLGRWIPTTSVDEYSATLGTWFGVQSGDLSTVLPNIGRFGHPNLGFMNS
ncbi:MAG: DUF1501 domain-containing protein [Chthoniobacteraceae bacterium]